MHLIDNESSIGRRVVVAAGLAALTPQKGFAFDRRTGNLYVSSWAGNIARGNINNLIYGKPISWTNITPPDYDGGMFRAGHIVIGVDPKYNKLMLISGGQSYDSNSLNFVDIRATSLGKVPSRIVIPRVDVVGQNTR